jgi:hypothetical protein
MGVLFLSLMVFTDGSANQDNQKIEERGKQIALGKQSIAKENLSRAKKQAVDDALYASVERAILEMLPPPEIAGNLALIYDQVLSDTQRYVETFRVLGEVETQGQYMVAVEAVINDASLEEIFTRAGILNRDKTNPSVLMLISEQSLNEVLSRYWWGNNPLPYASVTEDTIVDLFKKKGFILKGQGPDRPNLASLDVSFDFVHDTMGALKLARKLKADLLVMGRARAEEPSNRMGEERSYRADIDLELFFSETGEPMGAVKESAVVKSGTDEEGAKQALVQAGTLAAETLSTKISNLWSARQQTVQTIETRVEGADYLSSFIMLRKVLGDMPGIQEIKTREIGSDRATVDILFKGNAATLADLLMLKTFDSFGIQISEVTQASMIIRFITKNDVAPVPESEIKKAYISE